MSEYNNPRPLTSASASDPCTIVDNAVSLDKVINGDSTVTTYTGKELLSISQALDLFGFGVAPFTFTTGGTLESKNLLVSNDPVDGLLYKYVGSGSFPLTVAAGTNPAIGGNWQPFTATDHNLLSNRNAVGAHDAIYSRMYNTVAEAINDNLSVGTNVAARAYSDNSKSGVLFFRVVAGGTGLNDGGKYIDMTNGNQLMQNIKYPLNPMMWGAVDGVDAANSIDAMVAYFKSKITYIGAGKNYDAGGASLDFSGVQYSVSREIDFSGIDNLTIANPAFKALDGFAGDSMIKISSIDASWYVNNVTIDNPCLDAAWNAPVCIRAIDFVKLKVIGGKLTHYTQKGLKTSRVNVAPHELNLTGTFIFQREYNESFPVGITEGEAFEIDNYDNNFTGVVVGYQKKWTGTLVKGANMMTNCHFYSGIESWPESGLRSLDSADDFNLCYFDSVPLYIRNRSTVGECYFAIADGATYAVELTTTDPYRIKIVNCRFKKNSGASVAAIKMKTLAEGRVTRPDIYDNSYDGCTGILTKGPSPINMTNSTTTFTIPDQFLPLSSFGPIYLASSADGSFSDRIFSSEYNPTTKQITAKCYAISGGSITAANLSGKQALINFN